MSYNGYGAMGYGDPDTGAADYLSGAYGAYGGDPVLTTTTRKSNVTATTELQNLLIQRGFGSYLGKWGADGDFYTATSNALKAFQTSVGLPPTGVADQTTWDALRAVRLPDAEAGEQGEQPSYRSGAAKNWAQSLLEGLGVGAGLTSFQPSAQAGTTALTSPGTQGGAAPPEKPSMWPWILGVGGIATAVFVGLYLSRDKGEGDT